MRLRPSRKKNTFLLTISLAFTAIGVGMVSSGKGITGWFVALFFGICSIAFVIHLWPGASYLHLSPDGFVVCSLFRRQPLLRWDNVSEFHVAPIKTTIPLHLQIMENPNFLTGDVDTGFVERSMLSK